MRRLSDHTKKGIILNIIVLFFVIIMTVFFCACSQSSKTRNYDKSIELVDSLLLSGQMSDVVTELKKTEKKALSPIQKLGIYKRYIKIGENKLAEKLLEEAVKRFPDNKPLLAVYVNSLLDNKRIDEAANIGKKFIHTQFESIYSEILLSKVNDVVKFKSNEYIDLYLDVCKATKVSKWAMNAAVLAAAEGDLTNAVNMYSLVESFDDTPFFWALINYDAGNYVDVINFCSKCDNNADVISLASDSWLRLGEIDEAHKYWAESLQKSDIPAKVLKNEAKYSIENNLPDNARNILLRLVMEYPDYLPGLADYAKFAVYSSLPAKESEFARILKESGIKTLNMQKYEDSPRIPVEDAITRLQALYSEKPSIELLLENKKLIWYTESYTNERIKNDLYQMLEIETSENSIQNQYLLCFTVCYLIANRYEDEAASLFYDSIEKRYKTEKPAEIASSLTDNECNIAAWLAIKENKLNDALRLYENFVFERNIKQDVHSSMNLAVLYNAFKEDDKAMDIYRRLSSVVLKKEDASEVHYRIGKILFDKNDQKNALLSLSYSIELNPDNHRARLLLKQIQN